MKFACTEKARVGKRGMTRREMVGAALKVGAGLLIAEKLTGNRMARGAGGAVPRERIPRISAARSDETIRLPAPQSAIGVDLVAALKSRRSTRAFSPRPLPLELLSTLLWAAFGVNRPSGGRTAPSARGWKEIDVYAALPEGAYTYDAAEHLLRHAAAGDLRAATGRQDFVATAPLNLVYAADYARMPGADEETRASYAASDAGVIAQNVYLFCAAAGLATVVRASVDRKRLAGALGLADQRCIVLAQTVGYPA